MGESEEEFDRRKVGHNRFKFERRAYDNRKGGQLHSEKRDNYDDERVEYSIGRRGGAAFHRGNERHGEANRADMQLPFKRPRHDPEDEPAAGANLSSRKSDKEDVPLPQQQQQQQVLKSFKHFLSQQDDSISEEDALKKYNEYKENFLRRQLSDFFNCHKEEEWFKEKYHPNFCEERQGIAHHNVVQRLRVFQELQATNWCADRAVVMDNCEELIKFMDALVIKLEGGNDADLKILDVKETDWSKAALVNMNGKKYNNRSDDADQSDDDLSSSGSESDSEDEEEEGQHHCRKRRRRANNTTHVLDATLDETAVNDDVIAIDVELVSQLNEDAPTPTEAECPQDDEVVILPATLQPPAKAVSAQPLHKTNSIFLRNIHPNITRQEIEALCKSYRGFMRLALQDPAPERKFFRRGWVTFAPDVNIKEVCWNLNNIRLKDCDLGAIVNRELVQRVRPIGMVACHKAVMRCDVKSAARLVQLMDHRQDLWQQHEDLITASPTAYGFTSRNPLLKNITDFLVEEGDYEEQVLGCKKFASNGVSASGDMRVDDVQIEHDPELAAVLDRLVFYLRAVHSVDFYAALEYPNEDEMPHRCGIMHVRGAPVPPNKPLAQRDIDSYLRDFEAKLNHLMEHTESLDEDQINRLGARNLDGAVEDFLMANTQELGKDKWLCPLSGKKFKGPEFVRKHILNKYADQLDVVRKDVLFFNNYLRDPKRPRCPSRNATAGYGAQRDMRHVPYERHRVTDRYNNYGGARHSGSAWYDRSGAHNSPPNRNYAGGYQYDRTPYSSSGYGRRPYGDRGFSSRAAAYHNGMSHEAR